MRLARGFVSAAVTLGALAIAASAAFAQAPPAAQAATASATRKDTRIPIAAADLRAVFGRIGQDKTTATGLSVAEADLPASALGLAGGAHVYLWRGQSMALGAGGEAMFGRAKRELKDLNGKATGTVIDRRMRSLSGQLSLNFGHRDGWSYLTAGIGPTSFESYFDKAIPDGLSPASINFGGGARWFNWEHLAFTADLRFYQTKPALATPNTAPRLRKNVVVFSGGIAIK